MVVTPIRIMKASENQDAADGSALQSLKSQTITKTYRTPGNSVIHTFKTRGSRKGKGGSGKKGAKGKTDAIHKDTLDGSYWRYPNIGKKRKMLKSIYCI